MCVIGEAQADLRRQQGVGHGRGAYIEGLTGAPLRICRTGEGTSDQRKTASNSPLASMSPKVFVS
jgi:hypothetical protein